MKLLIAEYGQNIIAPIAIIGTTLIKSVAMPMPKPAVFNTILSFAFCISSMIVFTNYTISYRGCI